MKKILFLLLICFIKLNAYEYQLSNFNNISHLNYVFYVDVDGILNYKQISPNGNIQYSSGDPIFYVCFNYIKNRTSGWISPENFNLYYKNDLLFLNDLYTQRLNPFLNYLYNNNSFSNTNNIKYENFQILYNDEGYAVESIVGGVWKGLYDTPENSGYLYDKDNNILYKNGEVASLFNRFWFSLTGNVSKTLKLYYISMLGLNVFILILAVYLVKVLLGLIIKWITTVINNTKVNVNLGAQKRW